ncbi:MAG: hypothetical protein OXC60_08275 [Litoreibacter sp.]|nr:hypothetical protein [Litoreibacter sp.]
MRSFALMILLRSILLMVLAMALVATSGVRSLAHVTAQGEWVEICSPDGIQVVALDKNGDPIMPVPHCPDCVTQPHIALPFMQDVAFRVGQMQRVSPIVTQLRVAPQLALREVARGPPAYEQ